MVQTTHLERLYELDKAFAVQLDKILHEGEYISQLMELQEGELVQIVNYLNDTIGRLIRVGQSPRKCLHILHEISSIRKVLPSDYEVSGTLSLLGSRPKAYGASSEVHQGTLSARKEDVCIKRLRIHPDNDREKVNGLLRGEAILWKYLNHPNIVPFKGVTLDPPQLVSEWIPGGELGEYIKNNPSASLINLLLDVANGLGYLHLHGVIHGDLKGPNILVNASGNALITDFDLASIFRDPNSVKTGAGEYGYTPRWAAPEMFGKNPTPSKESDIFSFAMVAIEVFSGEVPFHGIASTAVPGMIMKEDRPDRPGHPSLTNPLWGLIQNCWEHKSKDRPGIGHVINELKRIKSLPPSKNPPEDIREAPRPNANEREVTPYDMGTPLPGRALPPPEVKGKGALLPKHGAMEDEDRKELGRKQSRKDLGRERRPRPTEGTAEATVTPEEGLPDLPRGAPTVDPRINVTSSSRPTTPKPSTQHPQKEGNDPPASNETRVSRGGTIKKPTSRYPPTVGNDNPPASGSRVTAEHHAPPQEGNNRKDPGRQRSRTDRHGRGENDNKEGAKKVKDTPEERPPDLFGSTAVVDPGINIITLSHPLTSEPPSLRDNNTATPPVTSAHPRVNVDQPPRPLTLPPDLGGESAATKESKPAGQTSNPQAVRPDRRPTGQIQNHPQTDVRQDPPPPQPPMDIHHDLATQGTRKEPAKCWEFCSAEWWKCNCTCCKEPRCGCC